MHVERSDLFDAGILVVDEYFEVVIAQQIKIHLVSIVANGHDEGSLLIKNINLLLQCQLLIFLPRNHALNIA